MAENKSASFEDALKRLDDIVKRLEGDDVNLEESVRLYEEGRRLVVACEGQLKDAEQRLRTAGTAAEVAPAGPDDPDGEIPF